MTEGVGGVRYGVDGLSELAPHRLVPWRRILLLLLLLALLLGLLGYCHSRDDLHSLDQGELVGHRSPVPEHLVVLLDESGSFDGYQQLRRDFLDRGVTWAPKNPRPDDTLTVIGFSGDAYLRLAPTTVAELEADGATYLSGGGADGTNIQPPLELAINEPIPGAGPRSVIVLTDTFVQDTDPDAADELVRELGANTMSMIVPEGIDVDESWTAAFPYASQFEAGLDSEDQTALALGRAVAHATGQHLEATDR